MLSRARARIPDRSYWRVGIASFRGSMGLTIRQLGRCSTYVAARRSRLPWAPASCQVAVRPQECYASTYCRQQASEAERNRASPAPARRKAHHDHDRRTLSASGSLRRPNRDGLLGAGIENVVRAMACGFYSVLVDGSGGLAGWSAACPYRASRSGSSRFRSAGGRPRKSCQANSSVSSIFRR